MKTTTIRQTGLARREMLKIGLGAGVLGLGAPLGLRATDALAADFEQAPAYFRFQHGEMTVTIVSDGHLEIPSAGVAANVDEAEVKAFLRAHFLSEDTNYAHTNHVLIETGDRMVLVDVGSGERFMPTAGKLVANLDAAGIAPEDVTDVALTHAHPDHVWGLLDEFEDGPRFPEAAHTIGAAEFDWWMADGRVDMLPDDLKPFAVGARKSFEPMADQIAMATDGQEIAPGIRMIATPGHTPGHMSLLVESAGETLLVTGDAINHGYAAFAHPDWEPGFDYEKAEAVATRKQLLDLCATDRLTLAGYHLPFPGVGHVARDGGAYRFVPALWNW